MIDAGEPVTFSCSEFNFSGGNDSYCMIVSTKKWKRGNRGNGMGRNNKGNENSHRPWRSGRSVGGGTDEETAHGPLANALLRGSLSQQFLKREKRHRNDFGRGSMEDENGSTEDDERKRRGGWKRGRDKKGQKFCDDNAPTNVEISEGTAKIMLVPNRRRKYRGEDSNPVLDAVAFECSWGAN